MNRETKNRVLWVVLALCLCAFPLVPQSMAQETAAEEVSPVEDLMREHGVVRRIFLIYEEIQRRVDNGGEVPADAVIASAGIVRSFIEGYHEELEEKYIFPLFTKSDTQVELVKTLKAQHTAGRALTAKIIDLAKRPDSASRKEMAEQIRAFIRQYRPHAAREDTVLFPILHTLVSSQEYAKMGERFEEREHELFGKAGFEGVVEQVAGIERSLGIYDLGQFTAH